MADSELPRRTRRTWRRIRSRHADVLEGLEAAVSRHPAGGGDVVRPLDGDDAVTLLRRVDDDPDDAA